MSELYKFLYLALFNAFNDCVIFTSFDPNLRWTFFSPIISIFNYKTFFDCSLFLLSNLVHLSEIALRTKPTGRKSARRLNEGLVFFIKQRVVFSFVKRFTERVGREEQLRERLEKAVRERESFRFPKCIVAHFSSTLLLCFDGKHLQREINLSRLPNVYRKLLE